MKKSFITLFILGYSVIALPQRQPDQDFAKQISALEAKSHENLFKSGNAKLGDNYDLKYHRMNWFVDPDTNFISGSVTSYFMAVSAISQMEFELNQVMVIDSVKYHNTHLTFNHPGNTFTINYTTAIAVGAFDSVSVFYHGDPQGGGFGSFIHDFHNGTPIIWTLSEPFGAPDWWPCKNSLSDKIDSIDVYVTTPAPNRVASNGVLVSVTGVGPDKKFHWKHRHPIATYLIAIAVTNYAAYSDFAQLQNGNLEILNYVYPEDSVYARQNTPYLIPVIQLYDSLFSDYPYLDEKYGHAQFGWGGGMEHQTMTFLINFGYDLMAHELAHQWFGDKVTCGSWHDIWINEGFATFLTGLTYYFLSDNNAWRSWKVGNINYIVSAPDGSVYCDDTTSVPRIFDGRLSYAKGALVLNMLRLKIGDSAMFTCMNNFITDPSLEYGFADTDDFKNHAQLSSGQNLTEFFNDWIYGQGYPVYYINSTVHYDSSVNIIFIQSPSHPSVSFFELPLPVRFSDGVHDTVIVFDNTTNFQSFDAHLNFLPVEITFDPESELIAVLDTCIVQVSRNNDSGDNDVLVYPSPAHESVIIDGGQKNTITRVRISDLKGAIIDDITLENPSRTFTYDLDKLGNGLYLTAIYTNNNIIFNKIIKM
ncbi:MAG TPA: M1 family aminopeptidase [Bacteroidales bacterium]|nr:M1 family aminopeptidase [Bacteroidales bacterium]